MLRKVLFVDDDKVIRQTVENRFQDNSDTFSIITAVDGFDACKKLEKCWVSLVVLDLYMPRMDGMSLLAHIKEKYADLPVILISSMEKSTLDELANNYGIRNYLAKPFSPEELKAVIIKALNEYTDGGILYDISPGVFLQLMEMEAKTCTIKITANNSEMGGTLYFRQGQLLDAQVGQLSGIEAAYSIFSWQTATLFIHKECLVEENRINSDLGPIIMHAATMHDEGSFDEGDDNFDEEDDEEGSLEGPFSLASLTDDGDANKDEEGFLDVSLTLDSLTDDLDDFGIDDIPDIEDIDDLDIDLSGLYPEYEDKLGTGAVAVQAQLAVFLGEGNDLERQESANNTGELRQKIEDLEAISEFGPFQVAATEDSGGGKIIIADPAPTVFLYQPGFAKDKAIAFLQNPEQLSREAIPAERSSVQPP